MRAPLGQRSLPRTSRVSTSSWKSATAIAEYRLSTAENARWETYERARVGERRPRSRLRATDLEADDRLACFRAPAQRVHESLRAAHGLEEEPDRARRGILREEREEVSGVCDRLGSRRHDATQPDAAAEREERVRDRARLAQHCDVTRRGRVLGAPVPRRRAARDEEPHAVRPEEHGVELARSSSEPLRGLDRCRARLGSDPGHDERSDARGRRLLERGFDALVVDHEECELGHFGQVGDGRVAAKARNLLVTRVDPPRPHPARDDRLDRSDVPR